MKTWSRFFALAGVVLAATCGRGAAEPDERPSQTDEPAVRDVAGIRFEDTGRFTIRGADSRRQLLVAGETKTGRLMDLTSRVRYAASPADIVRVEPTGRVVPLKDGRATITADYAGGKTASFEVDVAEMEIDVPVNFPNQIVPIFTKQGCNSGGCHGKASGQNGFRLSLLGFYPDDDYEFLVKEDRGRRLFPAKPDESILLRKASSRMAHGGGKRLPFDSNEYRLVRRWITQGMPYGKPSDPVVERIEIFPKERRMERRAGQQLAVVAHFSDGSREDVTHLSQFEPNDTEFAAASPPGVATMLDLTGDVAVMARYQGTVAAFRASVPLGAPVDRLPPARNFIDAHVFVKLKDLGIPPSDVADDAEFLRRVTIDIAGRLPTIDEATAFPEATEPDKRDQLIDRLLAGGDYADYFANKWSALLRNKKLNANYTRGTYAFHEWIRDALHQNRPFTEFVRDILAASGEISQHPPVVWYRQVRTSEQQVEDAAQLFLGQRIQCAKCHHHPFEKWSQRDYFGFEAFFSRVGRKAGTTGLRQQDDQRIFHNRGVARSRNPRTQETLRPTGLGSSPVDLGPADDPRVALADWMAEPGNPYFARSLANRYWKHFFGRGIVEPEDDLRATNPPSNPALLDALADHFVKSGYDLKDLVRTICRSTSYQLGSRANRYNLNDKQAFSRFLPKRLNAEVLYDAMHQVTNVPPAFNGLPRGVRAVQLPDATIPNYMLSVFGRPTGDSACECERTQSATLAQSLHLLNSNEVQGWLAASGGLAAQLAKDGKRSDADRVRAIYLRAYSRPPLATELKTATDYLSAAKSKQEALEDILWAIMNTKEFLFNH